MEVRRNSRGRKIKQARGEDGGQLVTTRDTDAVRPPISHFCCPSLRLHIWVAQRGVVVHNLLKELSFVMLHI